MTIYNINLSVIVAVGSMSFKKITGEWYTG